MKLSQNRDLGSPLLFCNSVSLLGKEILGRTVLLNTWIGPIVIQNWVLGSPLLICNSVSLLDKEILGRTVLLHTWIGAIVSQNRVIGSPPLFFSFVSHFPAYYLLIILPLSLLRVANRVANDVRTGQVLRRDTFSAAHWKLRRIRLYFDGLLRTRTILALTILFLRWR